SMLVPEVMLPFGGHPGFPQLINLPPNAAPPPTFIQQSVLMPQLQRVMVSTAAPQIHIASGVPAGSVGAPLNSPLNAPLAAPLNTPLNTPRPMLVPPQMAAEIVAANATANAARASSTGSSGSATTSSDIWSEHTASDGRVYYYNKVTKQSSWTKPEELRTPEERKAAAARLWREYKTPDGRPYYYNSETKETTWSCPKDFEPPSSATVVTSSSVKEEKPGSAEIKEKSASSTDAAPASTRNGESELEKAMLATLKNFDQPATEKEDDENKGDGDKATSEGAVDEEKELKKRQADKFRELLRDKYNDGKITSISSWEQAVKYIQHDPRFRILNKVSEKKQLFNAWKVQRQKEERDEKRLAIKKAKEDLEQWLQNHPKVRPTMRYSKAEKLFEEEPLWKAVHDSERKEIFRDALEFIDKREKENAKALRRRNVQALADILEGMEEITYRTTWAQAQRLLIENPAFANDSTLQSMDKEDALIVFEDHIRTAEKHYMKEREMEERRRKRQERKIREAFQDYLHELHKRGELTSMSLWSELYPVISADSRFDNMLTQSGSTPLDLFKFYVEDLKSQFGQDRRIIKDILKDLNVTVELDTTFDQLCKWVSSDDRGKSVDAGNMKLCYNSFMEKAEAKEKEQEREQARKRRRHETAFRTVLRNLVPPVEPNSQWDIIRPKIENEDAFLAVESEELRRKFFNDYIQNLAEACGHHHGTGKKKKKDKKKRKKDDRDSDSDAENRPKKSKKKHHHSDGSDDEKELERKRRKKSKKQSKSRSRSPTPTEEPTEKRSKSKHSSSKKDESNESELSEGELFRKRKELLNKLDSSPHSSVD
uniref:FF domain-containing protein n=2 Tax=Parascaris univalens TaxID=6257 RepID=A0A915BGX2_PARUN